jgi:CubicO group peptidase (beta-lactamase class C family)
LPNSPAALCRAWRERYNLPGLAAALVDASRPGYPLVYSDSFGFAQLELSCPLAPDGVFEIASLTKLFTAEAVMLLVHDGQLALETPIGSLLPELPRGWQAVTPGQILRHRSGIRNYAAVPEYWLHTREDLPYSHILDLVRDQPLDFEPGSRYAYDNTGFYLLGLLIEAVTGLRYSEFLHQRIFVPLGMSQTRCQDYSELIPRRVAGYSRVDAQTRNKPYYSPTGTYAAGCLVSSVGDLARWASSLHTDQIMPMTLREQMLRPEPSPAANEVAEGFQLGLGWFRLENEGKPFWGHNGGILGFASSLVHFPELRRTAIVLTNCDWLEEPHRLALELIDALDQTADFYPG